MPWARLCACLIAVLALAALTAGPTGDAAAHDGCEGVSAAAPERNASEEPQHEGELFRAEAVVEHGVYRSGRAAGVPREVMDETVSVFGRFLDLQHEVGAGDRFEILYERLERSEGASRWQLVAATVRLSSRSRSIIRYAPPGGDARFFDTNGVSVGSLLLRTPVDGATLSSAYGMREHPILGYTRMHKGVDYASPQGAPVLAAGDGVVEAAGRDGSYGIRLSIRHDRGYATLYAHLSSVAEGIEPGTRVRQGQVIGRVGATGTATGPHLHYEVHRGDEQINPAEIPKMPHKVLCGAELEALRWHAALLALRPARSPAPGQAMASDER